MRKPEKIEISESRFESNNLRFLTIKTTSLEGRGDCCVFVPPGLKQDASCPVVILLHGVYGSAWSWPLRAGVHLTVMKLINEGRLPNMVLAMPSDGLWGDGSAYLPHNSRNFEHWIASDIPAAMKQMIPGVTAGSPFFISGLSMGGFGSLRIGAKYNEKFSAVAAHSAITSLSQMSLFVEEELSNYEQQNVTDEDVFLTFQNHRHQLPPIYFDCGLDDQLLSYNRELHQRMNENNIPHIYKEFEGGHQWPYWEKNILNSLFFFKENLSDQGNDRTIQVYQP